MKISQTFGILAAGFMLSFSSCLASSPWASSPPADVSAKPKAGKDLKSVVSPDKKYTLILRDEGEQGDFVWYSLYLREGGKYTLIGTFNVVDKVGWAPDSSSVSFRGERAIESNVMEVAEFQYSPGEKMLKSRTIKKTPLAD